MSDMRTERDSMGEMSIPKTALYGPQTARAAENFPVSGWTMGRDFIAAIGLVKLSAAKVHKKAGRLDGKIADAIISAATEVIAGKLDEHFILDVFQTGSGTSSNMNANEVIANRSCQLLGGSPGDKTLVHPNDHVNMGTSSNDVIPTAINIAAARAINENLLPALKQLNQSLQAKASQFDDIVKIGRTHLMDAVPVRLGQEFAGYAGQIDKAIKTLAPAIVGLCDLPLGGTAVGTGLNAPEGFADEVCELIATETSLPFAEAAEHFSCQGAKDAIVFASGVLRMVAIAMGKIASDIRLMGSGPRCSLGELILPAVQPGSSIMPGKVNPVICESVIQVACQLVGCDAAIIAGATGGVGSILELNVAMPMMASNLLTSIRLLSNAATMFAQKCIAGLEANEARCAELIEQSLAMVTSLAPEIGYDAAADIAKEAHNSGKTIRQVCLDKDVLPAEKLNELLDARGQTGS